MTLTLLAAADLEWGIGIDGRLPWHVPEDLKRFRTRTMGKAVIMGRKTVDTLPSSLPGRRIVTLSRSPTGPDSHDMASLISSLPDLGDDVIVAGGGEVYRALLPHCGRAEITRIKAVHRCDAHLVNLAEYGWTMVSSTPLSEISDLEEWIPA